MDARFRRAAIASLSLTFQVAFAGDDALWDRAAASVARSMIWVAATQRVRTEVTNGKGELLDIDEDIHTLAGWREGSPVWETQSKHETLKQSEGKITITVSPDDDIASGTPFDISDSSRLSYQRSHEEVFSVVECVVFTYDVASQEGMPGESGMIWIDKNRGTLLRVETKPSDLVSGLSSMTISTEYMVLSDGASVPRISTWTGSGGRLWIRRRVTTRIEYSDWVRKPGTGESTQPDNGMERPAGSRPTVASRPRSPAAARADR